MGTSSGCAFHKEPAPTHIRLKHLEDDVGGIKHDMGGMKHDMREMKHMVQLLLEKQGLLDDRLDHDPKGSPLTHSCSRSLLTNAFAANPNVTDGILSPLVHRRSSSSDQA
jgi:hypothetical protein